ncbi:unnamed protein product [Prunus brigantina]
MSDLGYFYKPNLRYWLFYKPNLRVISKIVIFPFYFYFYGTRTSQRPRKRPYTNRPQTRDSEGWLESDKKIHLEALIVSSALLQSLIIRGDEERVAPPDAMDILCDPEWQIDARYDDQNPPYFKGFEFLVDIFLGSIIDLGLELDFLPLFATLLLQFYKTHSCDAT